MNQQLYEWCMSKPFYKRTDDELMAFLTTCDDSENDDHIHRIFRVKAYVFLLARMGDARTVMPYYVWGVVMGDTATIPTTWGMGMFPLIPSPHSMLIGH